MQQDDFNLAQVASLGLHKVEAQPTPEVRYDSEFASLTIRTQRQEIEHLTAANEALRNRYPDEKELNDMARKE